MDLKCVTAGSGGYFYKSHLPKLGPGSQQTSPDDTVQIIPELSSLACKADAGIQQSPVLTNHNRNISTGPLSTASSIMDLLPRKGAEGVKARPTCLSDSAVPSPDSQKVSYDILLLFPQIN